MGTICSRKTKLPFESHGWTSVERDIWWKQQVKCLGARPLYWQIIFGHPLSGFVLKNGAPKVWKMLILKCPAMRNGTDLRRLPPKRCIYRNNCKVRGLLHIFIVLTLFMCISYCSYLESCPIHIDQMILNASTFNIYRL